MKCQVVWWPRSSPWGPARATLASLGLAGPTAGVLWGAVILLGVMVLGQRSESTSHPVTDSLSAIVFVAAPIFDEKVDIGDGYLGSYHWRDGYLYARAATYHRQERTTGPMRLGKNLYLLTPASPDGQLRQLTFLQGNGAVYKPEPSYDGRKILFSMRRDGEDWFHLYELQLDTGELRQLTDGPFNDFAGVYLPDGRIVFVSDRTGFLEEYHEERTECLFVMNGDGTGIHQITFNPGTYFEPSVLRDGRIISAFWDAFHINIPPLDKHETVLITVNPDGTDERHYFGAGQHRYFQRERHSGVSFTTPRELPDGRILVQCELGPAIVDIRYGQNPRDALTPIFPGVTSVQIGGTTHRVHLSPLGTRSTAYPLPDGRVIYSATRPGARDSAIYLTDPRTREEKLIYNIHNYAEFDPIPVYWPRPVPRRLPQQIDQPATYASGLALLEESQPSARRPAPGWSQFLVVAGRESDFPERNAGLARARYLRVIEAEYTAVTSSSHTSLETRILGVVPIYDDGSAYLEVPADTPIFLDVLDAAGQRVMHAWPLMSTSIERGRPVSLTQIGHMSARSGEVRSCYGCHAPQQTAVPNISLEALRHPPTRVHRAVTNLQYRRNEPEFYRRQAIVGAGFGDMYRRWLESSDPWVRARGCEMLALVEDEAEAAVEKIVALTGDADVEVRRAATWALCMLARSAHLPTIQELAQRDPDPLVRFHAQSVLQVFESSGDEELEMEALGRQSHPTADMRARVRAALEKNTPPLAALRAAGRLRDAPAVPLLVPWLDRPDMEPYAKEAARALGRIASPEAIEALWQALRRRVPDKKVFNQRYFQHGPRPEEWAIVEGLILAKAPPRFDDLPLLVALLPNAFMEKPRFEDRLRSETARVVWPRILLERGGFRRPIVRLLSEVLRHNEPAKTVSRPQEAKKPALDKTNAALYDAVLQGVNLERPFSEHGRPFSVVTSLGAEEALWLLTCLAHPGEVPEEIVTPYLTSTYHRERLDAAVLLLLQGFHSPGAHPHCAEHVLLREASQAYSFSEIWSIGKGMPDDNFRDKAYMVQALAVHTTNLQALERFADPQQAYRDLRYALARGLARRGQTDAIPLLLRLCRDPLTVVQQQARYALAEIRDLARLRGEKPPRFRVQWEASPRKREPLGTAPPEAIIEVPIHDVQIAEKTVPPRMVHWSERTPAPLPQRQLLKQPQSDWQALLIPQHFRNLSIPFVRGAERMMIEKAEELQYVAHQLRRLPPEPTREIWQHWLESPYPYAQYLALESLALQPSPQWAALLLRKLDEFAQKNNTVGFWWCCEALAQVATQLPPTESATGLTRQQVLSVLQQYAGMPTPPGAALFGPEGMALGYPAARAIGRIAGTTQHEFVRQLWQSENAWLRAGVLRGLAEAKCPEVTAWLDQARQPGQPALVRHEAEVQLYRR
ncbi:MAG: HEAT repeat domain-containing protein [Gemmatales bacterium]|nr:HEAT repeat domain-containing protein [Gemmatales bacterium]MDW8222098.1 HEAT repeat domain-containing protein [Gemmatales bacterium]